MDLNARYVGEISVHLRNICGACQAQEVLICRPSVPGQSYDVRRKMLKNLKKTGARIVLILSRIVLSGPHSICKSVVMCDLDSGVAAGFAFGLSGARSFRPLRKGRDFEFNLTLHETSGSSLCLKSREKRTGRKQWSGRVDLLALSVPKGTTGLLVPNQMPELVELC